MPNLTPQSDLPISSAIKDIQDLLKKSQVVIIAGETGSGKSTQLPKICAKIREDATGIIGHTQPRRVAAVSLAERISEECECPVGDYIGYQIRFSQKISKQTKIKLMTDGVLLAEIQTDKLLSKYHTLIIDEAHERSLNIDFLLGYLKQILPKRPDLKLIITSATIDVDEFSKHFDNAPILNISGRTYPVEIKYEPVAESESLSDAIIDSVENLCSNQHGDILVFLSTEKEIHDIGYKLSKMMIPNMQVLKLYGRLSNKDQREVFHPGKARRVILSTNVAETSVTVPRIHYVIDSGLARVSRYSFRSKMQHLPIEKISQASAKQRSGRCGRIAPGICIRLYAEDDFESRSLQLEPEICRTNLASVILLMIAYKLGDINDFAFIEKPDARFIKDGYQLLTELQAIKSVPSFKNKAKKTFRLTDLGKNMAKFPVDPRLARMILASIENHCVPEVLVVTSFLSSQDPRVRPFDAKQKSDEAHKAYLDLRSDFVSVLKLWAHITDRQDSLSSNQFRKMCQQKFLSILKIKQWQAIYQQLKQVVKNLNLVSNSKFLDREINISENKEDNNKDNKLDPAYEKLHLSLLAGFISHIARFDEKGVYLGTRSRKGYLFPGSGLFKSSPKWVMSAYIRETTKVYFDLNAKIEPEWVVKVANHLVKKNYSEPVWGKKKEQAFAKMRINLYGLDLVVDQKVGYGNINSDIAREILIRDGLIEGMINLQDEFFIKNKSLLSDIEAIEDKIRVKDLLVDPEILFNHYDKVLPKHIVSGASLKKWLKSLSKDDKAKLVYSKEQLEDFAKEQDDRVKLVDSCEYPDSISLGDNTFNLSYHFEPGDEADGISVEVPVSLLNTVDTTSAGWLIGSLRLDKIIAMIKALPKAKRKLCVPVPDYAKAIFELAQDDEQVPAKISLTQFLAQSLTKLTGYNFQASDWMGLEDDIPKHLLMRYVLVDNNRKVISSSRDFSSFSQNAPKEIIQTIDDTDAIWVDNWEWDVLPEPKASSLQGVLVKQYPTFIVNPTKDKVALAWVNSENLQKEQMQEGLSVLCHLQYKSTFNFLKRNYKDLQKIKLYLVNLGFSDFASFFLDFTKFISDITCLANVKNLKDINIKSKKDFINLLKPEAEIEKAFKEWFLVFLSWGEKQREIITQIAKSKKQLGDTQIKDLESQLSYLFGSGFLSINNLENLKRYNIYLQGMNKRCDSASVNPLKSQQSFMLLRDYWERFCKEFEQKPENISAHDQSYIALMKYRWLVEEYRISIFAQSLGSRIKVSPKRMEAVWGEYLNSKASG